MQMISSATVIRMKGEGLTVFQQDIVNQEIQKMQEAQKAALEAERKKTRIVESSVSRKNRAKLAEFEKAEQQEIGKLMIAWAMFWYLVICIEKALDEAVWAVEDAAVSVHRSIRRMRKKVKKAKKRLIRSLINRGIRKGWIIESVEEEK